MASVRLRWIGAETREFQFDGDVAVITIGRNDNNMVVLPEPRVSGLHGRLVLRDGAYLYQDMGSTNGSLVRRASGRDVVVDPRKTPELPIQPGDELLLGDMSQPVRLQVIDPLRAPPKRHNSDISRRSVRDGAELGTALVNNPLTSRKILQALFQALREVSGLHEREQAVGRLLEFCLHAFRDASVAGFYRVEPDGAPKLEAMRARPQGPSRAPHGHEARELFEVAFSDEMVSAFEDDAKLLARAFGPCAPPLVTAMAAPVLHQQALHGLLFVASSAQLTQFDLDLLTVLAHQASASLENIHLIERLSAAEARLRTENAYLKEALKRDEVSVKIIGEAVTLKKALRQVEIVARTDTTLLLLGETGTGKELFAKYAHEAGPRRDRIFAAVNCGALVETLLESELFGHKKGAFTGAYADRKGLFQVADGGTLFLDEVGDVSPSLQVKLLRALENGEILPVGAVKPQRVDVRIVAATNKDLEREVAEGRFRQDLYYRLNVFPVKLPSLRERSGDAPILAEFFLKRFNERLGKRVAGFSPVALERLRGYAWPGNVRELQNEIERAVLLTDDHAMIEPEALSERISGMVELPVEVGPLKETMARLEEQYILRALREHGDNRTQTARTLGISRQALTVKLARYGLTGGDD